MDGYIDDRDISYTYGVIQGQLFETRYTDANNDGKIDEQDIRQIRDLISRTAREVILEDDMYHFKRYQCHLINNPQYLDRNMGPLRYWGRHW